MGKHFSNLLISRGYHWKTYYPKFVQILDMAFPPIRTENWNDYYEDCKMLRANFEDFRWKFDHVKELQQVSLMGEASHVVYGTKVD